LPTCEFEIRKENLILNRSNEDPRLNVSSLFSVENHLELPAVFDVRFCFDSIETIKHQNPTVVITPEELIGCLHIMLFYCAIYCHVN